MLVQYGFIALFIAFGFGFGILNIFVLSPLFRLKNNDNRLTIPYECGMEPIGTPYVPTDVRFYMFALLFVIFDVESLFLFPWAIVFRQLGLSGFLSMGVFMGVLLVGLMYAWKRGSLNWES